MPDNPADSHGQPEPLAAHWPQEKTDDTVPPELITRGAKKHDKYDDQMWQRYISLVEDRLQEATNATLRQNIQICLDFMKQHGYPAEGYSFVVHHGVLKICTDEERLDEHLRRNQPMEDSYTIVGPKQGGGMFLE